MIPILEILTIGTKILDKLIPDPTKKAELQLELLKLQQTGELAQLSADTQLAQGQIDVNVEEAKSESLFKSGWRPAVGWTCALGFAAKFLAGPFVFILAQAFGVVIELPPIDVAEMMPLLFGMLGLGAYRTFEKVQK